jgi:Pvc16 N-terminal domain
MSNFLAIATVTATLRQTLQNILDNETPSPVPGARVITSRPEDLVGSTTDPRINIYLYQVTPNAAWRNADLPTRRSDGSVLQRPQVALDLHYLLSCYGDETRLEPQRLLGIIARTMHAQPLLSRQLISDAIQAILQNDQAGAFTFLNESNLAEAVELVRFSPLHLSLEELSKIWSVFYQVQYALSVAYQGTVVLIESDDVPQKALPVRDRNLYAVPFHQPVIEQVTSQTEANQPKTGGPQPIFADSTLVITGQRLRADRATVQVGKTNVSREITLVRISGTDVEPQAQNVSQKQITLDLSTVPNLGAGVQSVQVIHVKSGHFEKN